MKKAILLTIAITAYSVALWPTEKTDSNRIIKVLIAVMGSSALGAAFRQGKPTKNSHTRYVSLIVVTVATLCLGWTAQTRAGGTQPKLATKLGPDSTVLTVKLDPKAAPTAGKTFNVTLHITPKQNFHVYSSTMTPDGAAAPMTIAIPSEIDSFFTLVAAKEFGEMETGYDSEYSTVTKFFPEPFDVIATIKVKENSATPVPFSLNVHFQSCSSNQCIPPRTFAVPMTVLGEKPLAVTIARGIADVKRVKG